jgi:hypothetical protein
VNRYEHHASPAAYAHNQLALDEEPRPVLDEVMQRPETECAVSVKHDGPVTTHELPSRFGTVGQFTASTAPQQILGADRQRKRAVLIATDAPFLVSIARSINGTATAALWPMNVPLELLHCDAVTVATSSATANITYLTENWAD